MTDLKLFLERRNTETMSSGRLARSMHPCSTSYSIIGFPRIHGSKVPVGMKQQQKAASKIAAFLRGFPPVSCGGRWGLSMRATGPLASFFVYASTVSGGGGGASRERVIARSCVKT